VHFNLYRGSHLKESIVIYFQPESHVASCRTFEGALKLCRFLKEWVADDPEYGRSLTFRAFRETSGKVSVHSSYLLDEEGMSLFKEATAAFVTAYLAAAA
jgi:hypothetical protein